MLTRRGLLKASLPIIAAPAIIRVADLMRISPERIEVGPSVLNDFSREYSTLAQSHHQLVTALKTAGWIA